MNLELSALSQPYILEPLARPAAEVLAADSRSSGHARASDIAGETPNTSWFGETARPRTWEK